MNTLTSHPYLQNGLFSSYDIRKLLLPLIAELLLAYLVGLADSVMVASAGEAAVSAVSLVDSVSTLMINIFAGLASGGAVVAGQYLGRKDFSLSRRAAEHLMVLLLLLSALFTLLLQVFQNPILTVLFGKADQDVRDNCRIYYQIVMYSVPFLALYNGGAALFRTVGDSRTPMLISVLMNLINIAGNAILIYGFHLGVSGVAFPTLISRGVAMAIILALSFRSSFTLNLKNVLRLQPNRIMVKRVLSFGIPNCVENGMFQFGKLLLMSLVSTLSTSAITANAIGNTVGNLHCVVGIAITSGLVAVVSRCAGAGDYSQARFYTKYLMFLTYIWQGSVCLVLLLCIHPICQIYNISGETARLAGQIMMIHGSATILIYPFSFLLNAAMRASGDASYSMVISVISMWVFRVALSYVLILGFGYGVLSIWIAWVADWVFRISFYLPRWLGHRWETKAVQ